MIPMGRAFIGIGSNEGDRLAHISRAAAALGRLPGSRLVQMATIIETEPVGGPAQDSYLNTAVELETSLAPAALLQALQAIEAAQGRRRTGERWGPRPIDLDILLYDAQVLAGPDLIIPHPCLHERRFALEPLAELAPELAHPVLRQPIAALLARLPGPAAAPRPVA